MISYFDRLKDIALDMRVRMGALFYVFWFVYSLIILIAVNGLLALLFGVDGGYSGLLGLSLIIAAILLGLPTMAVRWRLPHEREQAEEERIMRAYDRFTPVVQVYAKTLTGEQQHDLCMALARNFKLQPPPTPKDTTK